MPTIYYAASMSMFGLEGLARYDLQSGDVLLRFPTEQTRKFWIEDRGKYKFSPIGIRDYQRIMDLHKYEVDQRTKQLAKVGREPGFVSKWISSHEHHGEVFFPEIPLARAKEDNLQRTNYEILQRTDGTYIRTNRRKVGREFLNSGSYTKISPDDFPAIIDKYPASTWSKKLEDEGLLIKELAVTVDVLSLNEDLAALADLNAPPDPYDLMTVEDYEIAWVGKPLQPGDVKDELIDLELQVHAQAIKVPGSKRQTKTPEEEIWIPEGGKQKTKGRPKLKKTVELEAARAKRRAEREALARERGEVLKPRGRPKTKAAVPPEEAQQDLYDEGMETVQEVALSEAELAELEAGRQRLQDNPFADPTDYLDDEDED